MDTVRIGIVGMGVQGSLYAAILSGAPIPQLGTVPGPAGCRLTALSSRSLHTEQTAKALGAAWFSDWRGLIDSGLCDAVVITLPHYLHHEVAVYALERGLHVLCEKPAGVRASDVAQMVKAWEKHPELTLAMILNQRTNPLFRKLVAITDSGELGDLRRSNWIVNSWWRPDSYYASNPWRGTWGGEGGGVVVNQLPHQLDLWIRLCGMPRQLYCIATEGAWRDISVENDVTVVARYDNGATGALISCTHDPLGTDRLELDFDRGKIVVENSRKAAVFRFHAAEQEWNRSISHMEMAARSRVPGALYTVEELVSEAGPLDGYREIFENFAAHILRGEALIANIYDGLRQVQLANAIQLSGWNNAPTLVPCSEQDYDAALQERVNKEG